MIGVKQTIKYLFVLLALSTTCFANEHGSTAHEGHEPNLIDEPDEITAYIGHHLKDSHDFTLYTNGTTGEHIGFPLPVIVWTSEGLKTFMSSEFHHDDAGHVVVEKGGVKLVKLHSKILELEEGASEVEFNEEHHAENAHAVLDFSITKSVLGMLVVAALMLWFFGSLAKSYKKSQVPTGIGRFMEPLVIYVRDEIARPNIGEKKYRKFMGFLLTVFFFIWISNLLGLTPLGFNITGQIAVTVCLALFTFFIVQFSGNKDYWKHIFWMPGVPVPMKIILAPIEVLGMFTKPFSLLIRLFANMTAGHFVVMSLIALSIILKSQFTIYGSTTISILLALFISVIEVLVAFLQAYIFTMLSSLFIGMAVEEHDHH